MEVDGLKLELVGFLHYNNDPANPHCTCVMLECELQTFVKYDCSAKDYTTKVTSKAEHLKLLRGAEVMIYSVK